MRRDPFRFLLVERNEHALVGCAWAWFVRSLVRQKLGSAFVFRYTVYHPRCFALTGIRTFVSFLVIV